MGKSKTQTQGVDNVTAGRQHDVFAAGQALAGQQLAPVNGAVNSALSNYQNAATQGNLGLSALGGNTAAVQQLTNPYTQQVIDQSNAQFGKTANQAQNSIAARAAAAGAFGGDRAAVSQGVALGNLGIGQNQLDANLNLQGYQQAMGQAGQLAQLGLGANGNAANIGQYLTQQGQAAQSHNFDVLQSANSSLQPHGQTQTQGGNLFGDILGGASTVAGLVG